jgi:hypothetical protein
MMSSTVWSMSCPIALPRYARSAVWHHLVESPCTVAMSCEWTTGPTLYYSHLSTHLAGHDGATCPHILQAAMAQTSGTLETHDYAMETRQPSGIGRPAMSFFIYEVRGP